MGRGSVQVCHDSMGRYSSIGVLSRGSKEGRDVGVRMLYLGLEHQDVISATMTTWEAVRSMRFPNVVPLDL
jgi:hypothetical protein